MLLRNIAPTAGHCNGTKYVIRSSGRNVIRMQAISGPAIGEIIALPRIKFITNLHETEIRFTRVQFPIRPCFAITAHKSQGQSLDKVGISLMTESFTHGQLYVALSRSTSPNGIKIIRPNKEDGEGFKTTNQNIVYEELLD